MIHYVLIGARKWSSIVVFDPNFPPIDLKTGEQLRPPNNRRCVTLSEHFAFIALVRQNTRDREYAGI